MTNQINTVIIDDESAARDVLKKLLAHYCPDVKIIGEADSVQTGHQLLSDKKPDLVFLDIHLSKENSFTLLSERKEIDFQIIFTSGHSNYAISAFRVNATDYLLKPIDSDDLLLAVEKARKQFLSAKHSEKTENEILIPIHKNELVEYISSNEVSSLQADDNYTLITTKESKKYTVPKTLGSLEELLSPLPHFVRIHRSVMINLHCILSYSKTHPCFVYLKNGSSFEISRRKKSEILNLIKTQ